MMISSMAQEGILLDYTNDTGSDLKSGDIVFLGSLCCQVVVDIADGDSGSLRSQGVIKLTKDAAFSPVLGDKCDFDGTSLAVAAVANSGLLMGTIVSIDGDGDEVLVKLNF